MVTRRGFMGSVLGAMAAGSAIGDGSASASGRLAWRGPIGLELYTVRELFAKDPAGTLKQVAAVGYKEVEIESRNQARGAESRAASRRSDRS